MNRPTTAPHLRRTVPAALLVAVVAGGVLPGSGAAVGHRGAVGAGTVPTTATAVGAGGGGLVPADAQQAPAGGDPSTDPAAAAASGGGRAEETQAPADQEPSEAYQEWQAHAADRIAFVPGERVTVGFTPRRNDSWSIGGKAPVALPAGSVTGRAMAAARQGSVWTVTGTVGSHPSGGLGAIAPVAPVDAPAAEPASQAIPATFVGAVPVTASTASYLAPATAPTVPLDAAAGLRRQVFGFLPYWQLSGAATSLNYGVLTTIAYFSVGADTAGNLSKRNSNGMVTTGWAGWTSSAMTSVINAAHAQGTRVVLTASVFAWTSGGVAAQRALLGSATARLNLARQLAAAVRDRGADGVNLDFEPLVSGQEANFVAFLKTLRSQLNAIRGGYQITYDTTGYIGNYPLAASVGPAAADAVFIMGYDYRTASSSTSGSIDPLSGPGYDLADTVREYVAKIDPSRVILGLPWYGRAWSTTSSAPRAANQSNAKYGYSTAVTYANIPALVAQYGRRWDPVEQSPYIAYQRQNCTSTYGCVTSWRQVWYDDPASLALRYQLVNTYGLRGAGVWVLGYDGGYQDMVHALSDAFLVDHAAPQAGIKMLPPTNPDEGIVVAWSAADVSGVRSYDVQVSVDGGAWTPWLTATTEATDVWLGADGHGYAFRVRATDVKGNVGAWNVTASSAATAAKLAVGGFGRVTLDNLAYRTGPDTSDAKLGSLPAGTIVALTSGPVSSGGYTWYEVTQPIREWAPVSFVERGVWIAVASSTASYVAPVHAPNATTVDAGITGFDFGSGGLVGGTPAAAAGRTFSPNGDGARDTLGVRWTATTPLTALTLNILRLDGSLVGSMAVPGLTAGAHTFAWNGTASGARVPDGRYLLQLVGSAGSKTFRAPSAMPATPGQIATYAVTVDTVAPTITASSASTGLISPNGDGIRESVAYTLASAGGAVSWTLTVAAPGAAAIRTMTGPGGTIRAAWNGRTDAGTVAPDATYTVTLAACDVAGNCGTRAYPVRVDTTPAKVSPAAVPPLFSPNGDGTTDTTTLRWSTSETTSGIATIWRGRTIIRRWAVRASTGGAIGWNGRNAVGSAVADGRYQFVIDVRDSAGNRTVSATTVVVDRTVGFLRWSGAFFPQDGDALAPTSTVSWRLTRTATTTLAILDASGNVVRTVWSGRSLAAGTRSWTWNGRLADGTYAPQGVYVARLTVVSPFGTQVLTRSVSAAAFPARLPTTIKAGTVLTVSFSSTEPLRTAPRVTLLQPGLAGATVTATKLADGTYRAVFTVRPGATGAASVQIVARDTGGHTNSASYPIAMVQ